MFLPILFLYSYKLSLIVLFFSALLAGTIGVLLGPYRRRLESLYVAEGDRQAMLVETIHGAQTVKALSMEPTQRKKWDDRSAQAVAMHYRVGKISITATTISKLFEKLMTVAIVYVGATLVFADEITVGALVAFNMISGRVSGPLVQLVSLIHSYQETALSVRMLGEVMNRPAEAGLGHGLRPPIQGRIEFENVTFQYNATSPPALDGVSLVIPAGKIIGVVGRSGSGKTTITRMIQGMYQIQSGLIRIDGLDMRELDIAHLRQNIGVVLQDNFLFRGTVRENIGMARSNAGFPEIVHASKLAGADEFVERMPQSYDTMLEENGSNLSGGQKQTTGDRPCPVDGSQNPDLRRSDQRPGPGKRSHYSDQPAPHRPRTHRHHSLAPVVNTYRMRFHHCAGTRQNRANGQASDIARRIKGISGIMVSADGPSVTPDGGKPTTFPARKTIPFRGSSGLRRRPPAVRPAPITVARMLIKTDPQSPRHRPSLLPTAQIHRPRTGRKPASAESAKSTAS